MTKDKIKINFIQPNEEVVTIEAPVGATVLQVAHLNKDRIYLEGACEGSLACTTCHVVVDDAWFNKIPASTDEEEDMLDLAFGVQMHSRLGCQIVLTEDMDGIVFHIPKETRNVNVG